MKLTPMIDLDIVFAKSGKTGPVAMISGLSNMHTEASSIKETQEQTGQHTEWSGTAAEQLEVLTPRQHQIMALVLAENPSKNIATNLGVSCRTVENHHAAIMHKTGSESIAPLARLALMGALTASRTSDVKAKPSLA